MRIMYDAPQTLGELLAPKGITVREDQSFMSFGFQTFLGWYAGFCGLWMFGVAVAGVVQWFAAGRFATHC